MILRGLTDIRTDENPLGKLQWYCAPDSWPPTSSREGRDGAWKLSSGTKDEQKDEHKQLQKPEAELWIWPPAKKDFWRKTYYEPLLLKDDGPILYATLSTARHYTISTRFSLEGVCQFDQAGLAIRFDAEHWIKTGIEVVDGRPRLSCVVTNLYSDWSTSPWPSTTTTTTRNTATNTGGVVTKVENVEIRVHCRGTSFVVQVKQGGGAWDFVRMAHCSPDRPSSTFWAGVFACSPQDQRGGCAVFYEFQIQEGSHLEHNADDNQDVSC